MDEHQLELIKTLGVMVVEVRNGENLSKHLEDITFILEEFEANIDLAKQGGTPYSSLENLKNEFWRIKYEILEQI